MLTAGLIILIFEIYKINDRIEIDKKIIRIKYICKTNELTCIKLNEGILNEILNLNNLSE